MNLADRGRHAQNWRGRRHGHVDLNPTVLAMTPSLRVAIVLLMTGLTAPQSRANAQGGSVSAVYVSADHDLLGSRLSGPAARLGYPLLGDRLKLRVGGERLTGEAGRLGIPCAGLIPPGTCLTPEPLRDRARLTSASVGVAVRAFARGGVSIDLVGDVRLAYVSVDTRSETSDRTLSASKTLKGTEFGVEGTWSPLARLPLALEVGVTRGHLNPLTIEHVADGYTPFEGGFSLTHMRVGLGWHLW